MLELALKYHGGPAQIGDIAKSQKIPVRYLEQLLLVLKRRRLVVSRRGKEGGYNLIKHPSDVTVLEIVEAFDGPIELISKRFKKVPLLFEVFDKVQKGVKKDLQEVTLEDLVFKLGKERRSYIYSI